MTQSRIRSGLLRPSRAGSGKLFDEAERTQSLRQRICDWLGVELFQCPGIVTRAGEVIEGNVHLITATGVKCPIRVKVAGMAHCGSVPFNRDKVRAVNDHWLRPLSHKVLMRGET